MATGGVFGARFRDCVASRSAVAIDVTPGSARRRAQRRCSAPARLHRFGAAGPNRVARKASTIAARAEDVKVAFEWCSVFSYSVRS
jgi:hypothetical protein